MLTAKQYRILMLLYRHSRESGIAPSYEEMRRELGLRSKSSVYRLTVALEQRGFIERIPHCARALKVIKLPDTDMPRGGGATVIPLAVAPPVAVASARDDSRSRKAKSDDVLSEVPMMGRIAAGSPLEAIQTPRRMITVPQSLLGNGDYFALEVAGDSMKDAGILEGDTVVLRKTESAESGDIVVALIDGQEATLKRFRRKGDSIALEAANLSYATRIYRHGQIVVQGKLQALLRRC